MKRLLHRTSVLLVLAACAAAPSDSFGRAQAALGRDDLLGALLAYDSVPVMHVRYPEARAAAAAIERRMRRAHELLLEGLMRRSEWHDHEALACLREARDTWPDLFGIDALIGATENRLHVFGAVDPVAPPHGDEITTRRAPANPGSGRHGAGALHAEDRAAAPTGETETSAGSQPAPAGGVAPLAGGEDPIALGLVAVETRLGRGELEAAVVDLLELASRFPADTRVQLRLVRLLHQRALLRYGQGALSAAMGDWEQVLAIQPDHPVARSLLEAVRAEAAAPLH